MNCNACTTVNPLPSCLATGYANFEITNLTFPDYPAEPMVAVIVDTATGKTWYVEFVADDNIDIGEIFPLMNDHYYEIRFYTSGGVQVEATLGELTPCCIEFRSLDGFMAGSSEYELSTETCDV